MLHLSKGVTYARNTERGCKDHFVVVISCLILMGYGSDKCFVKRKFSQTKYQSTWIWII